jgi:hypothetical protein
MGALSEDAAEEDQVHSDSEEESGVSGNVLNHRGSGENVTAHKHATKIALVGKQQTSK